MTAFDDVNEDLPETGSNPAETGPAEQAEDASKPEGWQEKVEQVKQGAEKIRGLADKLRDKAA